MFAMNNKKQPPEVFYKKSVLKNFSILTGKYLCSSVFLIKLWPFRSATFLKRDSKQVFFGEYCEIFKKFIWKKICERLLLNNVNQNYSSVKTVKQVLKVSQHSQENTFTGVSFLINIVVACYLTYLYLKRGSGTGVFLTVI